MRFPYVATLLLSLTRLALSAAENPAESDYARIEITYGAKPLAPVLDAPLTDTQICVAPDGFYYLTGTNLAPADTEAINLWRSKDLKQWEPLGVIWSVAKDGAWQKRAQAPNENPLTVTTRAIRAPELHCIKGEYYLVHAMAYGSIGLLKSSSGQASGPYVNHAQLTAWGNDPSLFVDTEGKVFLVWGGGYLARLADDLKTLAEPPRHLIPGVPFTKGWGTMPVLDRIGTYGAQIFKRDGKYQLLVSDATSRLGKRTHDAFVATSTGDIYGPYTNRLTLVTHAGQSSVFQSNDGAWFATFNGNPADPFAMFSSKPGIVPLVVTPHGALRPSPQVILEKGVIGSLHPITALKDEKIRDPSVCVGHDGAYYLVGTKAWGWRMPDGGIEMWRSTDLTDWKPLGFVWTFKGQATWQQPKQFEGRECKSLWAPEVRYFGGTYWITYSLNWMVTGILKSTSGKPEGPYVDPVGKPITEGIDGFFFPDADGKTYFLWAGGKIAQLKSDGTGFAEEPREMLSANGEKLGYEGSSIIKHRGKYVVFGSEWFGDHEGSYDLMYAIADSPYGPWQPRRYGIPHAGHATVFQGSDQKLYCTVFGSDGTAPFHMRLGLVEIEFDADWNLSIKDRKIGYE